VTAAAVTRVACLTPPGRGAIATIGLHGPQAWEITRQLFRTRKGTELPATPLPGRFWLGRLGTDIADEVILAVRQTDPVPYLEAHCHGGREAVRLLLDLFRSRGLVACSWDEFLHHTDDDPLRAAAAVALARAPTVRTAAILLDQHRGAFAAAIADILASLDHGDTAAAAQRLDQLAHFAPLGRHLTDPWRVTVAGAPNVGKSSLVNALAGYQRSVVAPTPGTTRDVVTVNLAVDGWPVELSDTAGLRTAGESLEEAGIQRARAAAAQADLCLWVLNASAEPVWPDAGSGAVRLVVNKVDLPPAWDLNQATGAARVSAQTGEGLPELCAALSGWLVPDVPPEGTAVPFTLPLCERVEEVQQTMATGQIEAVRDRVACFRGLDKRTLP
jgi:tRNA modification GTPase